MPQLAHKIKIYPNEEALSYFVRACGIARFVYNWALVTWQQKYKNGEKGMSGYSLCKEFNSIKEEQFPWVYEVTKWAAQKSIYNLHDAFKRFFKKESKYPKLKKKGRCEDSFYIGFDCFSVRGKYLKIPNFVKPIKMATPIRFKGELKSVTISRKADEWFASFSVKIPDDTYVYKHKCETQAVVGVDLGVRTLAVCSDGSSFELPRKVKRLRTKLVRAHRKVSRKQKGSQNRNRARQRLARIYLKATRLRLNVLHLITARLVKAFRFIGIEDLNIKGMLKNHRLARAIQECGFYEFKRQLNYKSGLSGSYVAIANMFFASSKTCSVCGYKNNDLKLKDEYWTCPCCNTFHNRDFNASINLKKVAGRYSETINACGGDVSLIGSNTDKQSLLKQESELKLYV